MKKAILILISFCYMQAGFANNIAVSNAALSGQNTTAQTININFDVSWENSWRTSTNESNYDGAWVFVKFRKNGTLVWNHCHVVPQTANANATLTATPGNMGVFIYHTGDTIGNVNYTGNQLLWNYGNDGVANNDSVEIKVFALEMVYIPTGSYWLGSGGGETNTFKNGNTTTPFRVDSAGAIPVGTSGAVLNSSLGFGGATQIPASYPNGYNAYWVMKYECTQQQYADFLNCVSALEAAVLVLGNTGANSIFGSSAHPNFVPVAPERAYNNINKSKVYAFADWSGLRPMSEMEFEKACRGVNTQYVPNEYAWGSNATPTILAQLNQIIYAGTDSESVINTLQANAILAGAVNRPVRVGIFARPSGSTRLLSGATYYGVLNMSDNLYEIVIYSGNAQGQAVTATEHGNGSLNPNGNGFSDVPTWIADALGFRGSFYDGSNNLARVSDRQYADDLNTGNNLAYGIRLARTAQ